MCYLYMSLEGLENFLFGEKPRGELRAPKPGWEWFPDWIWDTQRWALKEPVKATQTPVKGPKVAVAVSGFRPAAFAACGKTRG